MTTALSLHFSYDPCVPSPSGLGSHAIFFVNLWMTLLGNDNNEDEEEGDLLKESVVGKEHAEFFAKFNSRRPFC